MRHDDSAFLEPGELAVGDGLIPQGDLNLCSALAHVIADTMRTVTVMVCALLVQLAGLDPVLTDAVGSLIVCGVILVVAAYIAWEACNRALALMRPRRLTRKQKVPTVEMLPSEDGADPEAERAPCSCSTDSRQLDRSPSNP